MSCFLQEYNSYWYSCESKLIDMTLTSLNISLNVWNSNKNDIFTCYISPLLCSLSILPVANSQFFTSTPIIFFLVSAPATRIKTRFSIQRKAAFSGQCQHLRRPQIPRPHSLNRQRSSKSSHSKNMLLPHHQNLNLPPHHGTWDACPLLQASTCRRSTTTPSSAPCCGGDDMTRLLTASKRRCANCTQPGGGRTV